MADINEGRIVAIEFTPDGEVPVVRRSGIDLRMPMPKVEFTKPPKMKQKHHEAMMHMDYLVGMVKAKPNRKIPLTRNEAVENGLEKKDIKALEDLGLIRQRILDIKRGKKSVGGMACIYFTPLGHAYMREKVYADTGTKTGRPKSVK